MEQFNCNELGVPACVMRCATSTAHCPSPRVYAPSNVVRMVSHCEPYTVAEGGDITR